MVLRYETNLTKYNKIPGNPIAYWASQTVYDAFDNKLIEDLCSPKCGLKTGITEKYVLCWHEVNESSIGFNCANRDIAKESGKKWFPASDGQEFRKWYGNNYDVVFWLNDGYEIRNLYMPNGKLKSRPQNMNYYFQRGITWSALTSKTLSLRLNREGNIITGAGYGCFNNNIDLYPIMGLLNSKVANEFSRYLSGTLNFEVGVLSRIPVASKIFDESISRIVEENIKISKQDWDSFETSWDFKKHPLI